MKMRIERTMVNIMASRRWNVLYVPLLFLPTLDVVKLIFHLTIYIWIVNFYCRTNKIIVVVVPKLAKLQSVIPKHNF